MKYTEPQHNTPAQIAQKSLAHSDAQRIPAHAWEQHNREAYRAQGGAPTPQKDSPQTARLLRFPPHNPRCAGGTPQPQTPDPCKPRARPQTHRTQVTRRDKSQERHTHLCSGLREHTPAPPLLAETPLSPASSLPGSCGTAAPTLPISFPRRYTRPEPGSRRKAGSICAEDSGAAGGPRCAAL
jgi:hypothetical protein